MADALEIAVSDLLDANVNNVPKTEIETLLQLAEECFSKVSKKKYARIILTAIIIIVLLLGYYNIKGKENEFRHTWRKEDFYTCVILRDFNGMTIVNAFVFASENIDFRLNSADTFSINGQVDVDVETKAYQRFPWRTSYNNGEYSPLDTIVNYYMDEDSSEIINLYYTKKAVVSFIKTVYSNPAKTEVSYLELKAVPNLVLSVDMVVLKSYEEHLKPFDDLRDWYNAYKESFFEK